MTEFDADIAAATRSNPRSVELARWVSLAARVEPALLRRARLNFMPKARAETEADLWFGPLVQTRGARAVIFYPEVSARLRRELVSGTDVDRPDHPDPEVRRRTAALLGAWRLVREIHRHRAGGEPASLLQLEEELTWVALTRSGAELEREIDARLRRVIKAIVDEGREGLGRWALSVLPRLPAEARMRTSRLLQAVSESRLYGGWVSLDPNAGEELSESERNLLLRAMERVEVGVRLAGDTLELSSPPSEGSQKIELPATHPLSLDLRWPDDTLQRERRVEWEAETAAFATGVGAPLTLTTQTGDTYRVLRQDEALEPLRQVLKPSTICLLDESGRPSAAGLLVGRGRVVAGRAYFNSLLEQPRHASDRERTLALRFPLLDTEAVVPARWRTPAPFDPGHEAGFVRLTLTQPVPAGAVPAKVGPASAAVGKTCAAVAFTPRGPEGEWLRLEVRPALEDGAYGVRVLTEVGINRLQSWDGAPVISPEAGVIGVLSFRPSPDNLAEGTFRLVADELLQFLDEEKSAWPPLRVFVAYSHGDRAEVRALNRRLRADGVDTWLDEENLRPGDRWEVDIPRALAACDVVVLCLSPESVNRKGYFQKELRLALDILERQPEGTIYLIPLKLRDVGIPPSIREYHAVNYFEPGGYEILLRALVERARQLGARPPVAAHVRLRQLPPPPRDFTGRARELDELLSRIESGGVTISGLQGMGGIGKTALALKLAEHLAPRYPDAQFYLDLKGAGEQPLSAAEALAHVVRAYHPTEKLPEGEAELKALYMLALHGKRALLLMDNASGREQVVPLVPPEGCILLVTSRQHFTIPGLFALDLETLPPESARELLLKIAPRIGEHADEMAKLCGYLPLALRLAASALAERANLSPADYVRRLSDAKTRLSLIEASLTLSYKLLTAELQTRWRALAVFPAAFDAAAAAALWKLDRDAALDTLGELLRYSMVNWDHSEARYHLHDLARLFAAARLEEEEGDKWQRHAQHYLNVLKEAEDLYLRGGRAVATGLSLFDEEWPNIRSGQERAARHTDNLLAESICSEYALAAPHLLDLRLHPRQRVLWAEAGLAAARRLGNREAEGAHMTNLGTAYVQLYETRRGIELLEQALAFARERSEGGGEVPALGYLGLAHSRLGDTRLAVDFYERQLKLALGTGDRRAESFALTHLGAAYIELHDLKNAADFIERAINVSRETGDPRGESDALGHMGDVYISMNEPQRATELYGQQLVMARELRDRFAESRSLDGLGRASASRGEPERAIEYFTQAHAIARELVDLRLEGDARFDLSLALHDLGQLAEAVANAEMALEAYTSIEHPRAKVVGDQLTRWRR